MGERRTETSSTDGMDDLYDPAMGDFSDEEFDELELESGLSEKARLAAKRRRAEQRLEALRLRDELGDYDFDFDDDF